MIVLVEGKSFSQYFKKVKDYAGYYPFGALHSQLSDYQQKYLFGGKELQTELDLGWSDFGVRCFDNWKAKWEGIDILAEAKSDISPYSYGRSNPIRFSDPTGMIEEDENGLMTVSTDLSGQERGQKFLGRKTAEANQRADNLMNRQAGHFNILTGSGSGVGTGSGTGVGVVVPKWLSDILNRDLTTYSVEFNKYAGDESSRTIKDNGVDISYEGEFVTRKLEPNQNMLLKNAPAFTKFYNMKNAAYTKMAYDAYSIGKFSATMGTFGKIVGKCRFIGYRSKLLFLFR